MEQAAARFATSQERWRACIQWVDCVPGFIREIASLYRHYLAADQTDLTQQAYLAAYDALEGWRFSGMDRETYPAFFRNHFRNQLVAQAALAAGREISDSEHLVASEHDEGEVIVCCDEAALERVIQRAVRSLPKRRQQQIASWVLTQDRPCTINQAADAFGLSPRYIRKLIAACQERLTKQRKTQAMIKRRRSVRR